MQKWLYIQKRFGRTLKELRESHLVDQDLPNCSVNQIKTVPTQELASAQVISSYKYNILRQAILIR